MKELKKRTEILMELAPQRVVEVVQDYRDAGAEVTVKPEPSGNFRVQAEFMKIKDIASEDAPSPSRPAFF